MIRPVQPRLPFSQRKKSLFPGGGGGGGGGGWDRINGAMAEFSPAIRL